MQVLRGPRRDGASAGPGLGARGGARGVSDRDTEPGEPRSARRGPRAAERARDRSVLSPRGEHFEVVGRAGPVELQGAPPIPAEAREELLVIKDGELFLCTRAEGDVIPAQVSGEGFYAHDTRYLSEMRLEVGGA